MAFIASDENLTKLILMMYFEKSNKLEKRGVKYDNRSQFSVDSISIFDCLGYYISLLQS